MKPKEHTSEKYKIYVSDFAPDKLERTCAKMQIIQKRLADSRRKMFIHLEVNEKR